MRIALFIGLALLLTACSSVPATSNPDPPIPTNVPPEPSPPTPAKRDTPLPTPAPPPPPERHTPPPTTAVSSLRTDGNLHIRHRRIVDEAMKGGHEIAFLGDSITEGWATAGKAEWDKSWAPRHAINCGISGDCTQHVLGRLDHGLMDGLAGSNNGIKWVVLMIGTNNTWSDSAEDIAAGIHAIVARLHHGLPNARIVLVSVFPRGQFPNPQRDTINAVNTRIAPLVDGRHVVGLDIGPKFLKADGELPGELMPDFLHLSPAGYQIWSAALEESLR